MKKAFFGASLLALLLLTAVAGFSGDRSDDPLGVAVSPQNLILNWDQGGAVVVHTDIPYGAVDCSSLELSGVPVWWTKADDRGCLVAFFHEAEVEAIVSPPAAVLTLTGCDVYGEEFVGSDTVMVSYRNR